MNKKNILYLVYHFSKVEHLEGVGKYQVLYLFSNDGLVSKKDYPDLITQDDLIFDNKEDLISFGQSMISAKAFSAIYILSTADFNIGIETCQDLSSFKEIFKRYGQLIEGSTEEDDSNLFSKFF